MYTKLIAFALVVLTGLTIAYFPNVFPTLFPIAEGSVPPYRTTPINVPTAKPKIEVVFALDTTGSMGGLIDTAKDKIWSIATTMASAQPAPEIRMGLVAYRDRGDEYVTRVFDLSDDLDTMYAQLMDFAAAGGGDGPESVNQALNDAVNKISWSQDPNTYKVVFLVGDAPPHMDYPNEARYPQILKVAGSRGIVVNTIRCGNHPATEQQWQLIAAATQGQYLSVDQAGGAIAVTTPFDDRLAELSAELDATRLYYGNEAQRAQKAVKQAAADKLHNLASTAVRARRATFNALESGLSNLFGDQELISAITDGNVDLDEIAVSELPQPLVKLEPAEREAFIAKQSEQRAALRDQITELAGKRDSYLGKVAKDTPAASTSLDYLLFETVKKQTADKGLRYDETPKL